MFAWYIIFFLTAFFYSSAGMGGASAYLAWFSLMDIPHTLVARSALLLSILSSGTGLLNWFAGGNLNMRITLPFLIFSVPSAFAGGLFPVEKRVFDIVLSVVLLSVGFLMLLPMSDRTQTRSLTLAQTVLLSVAVGVPLGFLGGMIGIGCGVFVVPVLYYLRVATVKQASATGSAFIFFNSIAGFAGHTAKEGFEGIEFSLSFLIPVFAGAFLGSRFGSFYLPQKHVKTIFGLVVLSIGVFKLAGFFLHF